MHWNGRIFFYALPLFVAFRSAPPRYRAIYYLLLFVAEFTSPPTRSYESLVRIAHQVLDIC